MQTFFRAGIPHHRAQYNKGTIANSFSYMGHNVIKCACLTNWGALGGPFNNQTGSILLPGILSPMSIYIKYVSNPIRIFSYCKNDEVSADAAGTDAA